MSTIPGARPNGKPGRATFRGLFDDSPTRYTELSEDDRAAVLESFASVARFAEKAAQCLKVVGDDLADARGRLGPELFGRWAREEFQWSARVTAALIATAEKFDGDKPPKGFGFVFLAGLLAEGGADG